MDEYSCILEFLSACEEGDFELVENFLLTGSTVDCEGDEMITPLQIAAAKGHIEIVKCLLNYNADVNKCNNYGWTPLMHASRNGHLQIVDLLLTQGADVNLCNNFDYSACDLAAASGNLETFRLLYQCIKSNKVPLAAAVFGHEKILQETVDKSECDVFDSGVTPFMLAVASGQKNAVDLLVQNGWNVNMRNSNNNTATDISLLQGNKQMDSFLKSSMKKYGIYSSGRTSLMTSCSNFQTKGKSAKDSESKRSSLMACCLVGNFEMVKWWIEKCGVNVNQQDLTTGWTPLMNAAAHGQKEIVEYLLQKGANLNITNSLGMTAFDVAVISRKNNSPKLLQSLVSNTAKIPKTPKKIRSAQLGDDLVSRRERSLSTPSVYDPDITNCSFGSSKNKSLSSNTLNIMKSSLDLQLTITDCASIRASSSAENVKKFTMNEKGSFCNDVISHDCINQLTFSGKQNIISNAAVTPVISPDFSWFDQDDVEVGKMIKKAIQKKQSINSLKPVKSIIPKIIVPQKSIIPEIKLNKSSENDDVNDLLKQLSLEKYSDIFEEEAIDFSALLSLSSGDLKELKIETLDRQELLNVIQQLKTLND